jgi:hypothetical protein
MEEWNERLLKLLDVVVVVVVGIIFSHRIE